jgi:hypothetical protein
VRHVSCRGLSAPCSLRRSWLIFAAVLVGVVYLKAASVSVGAGSNLSMEAADALASVTSGTGTGVQTPPAPVTGATTMHAGHHLQAPEVLSHTVFLPWASNRFRPDATRSFGVQIFQAQPEVVTKTAQTGASWVRLPINWSSIEPVNTTPEDYQWPASFDAGLERLAAQHFEIILTLTGNPSWAATYPGGPIDRTDIGELVEFLSAAVARYSTPPYDARYWELYNEPDNGDEIYADYGWGYFGNEPAAYAQMLATVYQPMKAANPAIQVLFGGISFDNWVEEGGPFVADFLDQVLQHNQGNVAPYFDVMNFHYYPNYHQKWSQYGIGLIGKTNFLRDKLAIYGLDKPFVCTETGSQASSWYDDSYEEQSRYVVQTFVRGTAASLQSVIWFMLADEPDLGYWKTGLLNADLTPKPAFYAYQTVVDQLGAVDYIRAMLPGEFSSEWIEGYLFFAPESSTQILAVWSQNEDEHQVVIPTPQLTIVGKYGDETIVRDGDDGTLDDQVQVGIGSSPVYLRFAGDAQSWSHDPVQDGLFISRGQNRSP